ncbi:MAG: beta-lactamase family protein [Acidobacteria bacterium]|nr:beta-lactamase family protein [Acidobacteriota bacterium]
MRLAVLSLLALTQATLPTPADPAVRARAALTARLAKDDIPALSVAVGLRGKIVYSEAFGHADRESRKAATTATRFGIGSITKALTMALAGRLIDQGRLDLDAPVERYLPEFPYAGRGITTRLVAGHLSGLGDDFANANRLTTKHYDTAQALSEILEQPPTGPAGAEHAYGTGTYTVIAAVIEKVSGEPFERAMRRHVLDPLKMTSTVPNDPRAPMPARATFYETDSANRPVRAPRYDPSHKLAGAGYLSTAEDLVRFGSALLSPGFLSASTLEQLFTPLKTSSGTDTGVGLGFRIGAEAWPGMGWTIGPDDSRRRIVHQPGGGPGISSWLVIDRDARLVAVVLANKTSANVGGKAFDEMLEAFLPGD